MAKYDYETREHALQISQIIKAFSSPVPVHGLAETLKCEYSEAMAAVELLESKGIASLQVLATDPTQEHLTGVVVKAVACVQEVAE